MAGQDGSATGTLAVSDRRMAAGRVLTISVFSGLPSGILYTNRRCGATGQETFHYELF